MPASGTATTVTATP